jgi:ribosome-binding factor A
MQKEVGEHLSRLELPALTTISKVEVSPDLKWARLALTIMGDSEKQSQVLAILVADLAELQEGLNHKMKMKFVPRISYVIDEAEEYAARINELIQKTHEE